MLGVPAPRSAAYASYLLSRNRGDFVAMNTRRPIPTQIFAHYQQDRFPIAPLYRGIRRLWRQIVTLPLLDHPDIWYHW